VRVRRVALGLRGPSSFPFGPRRSRGLPVLVPVVSQRARVLRLRRTVCSLASIANQPCCLPPIRRESASWFCVFRSSIARPTDTPVYASSDISRCHPQDSGPRWSRSLLSGRTLSFLTTCRFIPAHPDERRPCGIFKRPVTRPPRLFIDRLQAQVLPGEPTSFFLSKLNCPRTFGSEPKDGSLDRG